MEDLQIVESVVRKDPKVIEQCGILGIPADEMHKVYCDRTYFSSRLVAIPLTMHSLDDWIRRALWHQVSSAAGSDVLPPARG